MIGSDNLAKKKKKSKKTRRLITFGFTAVIVIAVASFALFSVFSQIIEKHQEKRDLEDKLVALQEKELELENDVNKLKDPEYLARYAREKYFYSKDGEYIIRIPDEDEQEK